MSPTPQQIHAEENEPHAETDVNLDQMHAEEAAHPAIDPEKVREAADAANIAKVAGEIQAQEERFAAEREKREEEDEAAREQAEAMQEKATEEAEVQKEQAEAAAEAGGE